eukprot:COSAG01_NODE_11296_length_1964_cov_2.070241_1_plen_654_part_11
MTKSVAEKHWNVNPDTLVHTESIRHASGGNMNVYGKFCGATIFVNQQPVKLDFIVADLDIGCDLLLGMPLLKHYKAQIDTDQGVCVLQINGGPLTIGQGANRRIETTPGNFDDAIAAVVNGSTTTVQNVESLLRQSTPLTAADRNRVRAIAEYKQLAVRRCTAPATACTEATWQRTQARALAAMCHGSVTQDRQLQAKQQRQTPADTAVLAKRSILSTVNGSIATETDESQKAVTGMSHQNMSIRTTQHDECHPRPKRPYVPPHFPLAKPLRNPTQDWSGAHEWCCQIYAMLQSKQMLSVNVTAANNFATIVKNFRDPEHPWWKAISDPIKTKTLERLAETSDAELRAFFIETASSDKYNKQSRESPFSVQFVAEPVTIEPGSTATRAPLSTHQRRQGTTRSVKTDDTTVSDIIDTLGMDQDGNFIVSDPDADAEAIRDYLSQHNEFVRKSDLAAVMPGSKQPPTLLQHNTWSDTESVGLPYQYDMAAITAADRHQIQSDFVDQYSSYTEVDESVPGLVWHHDPIKDDSYITVDVNTFLDSHADVVYKPGTSHTQPVAATSSLPYLQTKPDSPNQKPPPQSANYVPPPNAAQRKRLGLDHLLDSDGLPHLHVTDELKQFVNKSEPALQDLHDFIKSQNINYKTEANGLPDASDI